MWHIRRSSRALHARAVMQSVHFIILLFYPSSSSTEKNLHQQPRIRKHHTIKERVSQPASVETMLSSIAFTALRAVSASAPQTIISRAPVLQAAVARYATQIMSGRRFASGSPLYAVDAPNGDHDLQDIVRERVLYYSLFVPHFFMNVVWSPPW